MIITRKIQLIIAEKDKETKSSYYKTIREWSRLTRMGANAVMSHKFTQQNIRDFVYIKDEIKDKFYVKDIIVEGKGMSEQNTTYRVLSDMLKGNVPSDIYSCLNSVLAQTYKKRAKDMMMGKMSLPSFKNDIPMPFSKGVLEGIQVQEVEYMNTQTGEVKKRDEYSFSFFGIPMQLFFGKDKSGNKALVDKCMCDAMEYKFAQSSIVLDGTKLFMNLCISIPESIGVNLDPEKVCSAMLSITTPIVANVEGQKKLYEIGSKEEFLAIREHVQGALHRIRKASRFGAGGKGRERKMQATERFEEKEKRYCQTMMHVYSKRLIDYCLKNKCGKLRLIAVNETEEITADEQSEIVKSDPFLLRNWSYHGLLYKIKYKCAKHGIELIQK